MQSHNEIIIAAAGGGKTTRIVREALAAGGKTALVTYTQNNVSEIRAKLYAENKSIPPHVEVWSWFRFLLHEMARPYQSAMYGRRIQGLHWIEGRSARYAKRIDTDKFYFSSDGAVYSDKISQFIIDCNAASSGAVIRRLEQRFKTIFIDEVQDLAGYDLELLELLLKSQINIILVGDHRQATYNTNNSAKNKAYSGVRIIAKFQDWQRKNLSALTYDVETYRCNQAIANVADMFYPNEPSTVSLNSVVTGHDGVFLVSEADVPAYIQRFRPQILRLSRRTNTAGHCAINFGDSKGLTFERVLIFPHGKGKNWLKSGNLSHVEKSLAKMYVGVSRARYSVAFVYDGTCGVTGVVRYP